MVAEGIPVLFVDGGFSNASIGSGAMKSWAVMTLRMASSLKSIRCNVSSSLRSNVTSPKMNGS